MKDSLVKRVSRYLIKGIPEYKIEKNISFLKPSFQLKEQKILITGGSKGLGLAMAKRFISEGARVTITGRDEKSLKKVSDSINCQYLVFDINEISKSNEIIKKSEELMGGLTCLVNNAGISLHEPSFLDVTEEQYDSQFNTNLKGAYFLTQAFIKHQLENKAKSNILFISSERGETVEVLPYGLTKAAITSFVKGLAARYIQKGIRINGIAPGITASEMTGFNPSGNLFCNYNITKRVYLPEEIAEVATFLLSDVSATLNGQILVCNEGKTLNV